MSACFVGGRLECEGAHVIAQKTIPVAYDESSLLQRAGLTQKHQVQNGLLLCITCHSQFEKLMRYVDVVDDKLVVNETNDATNLDWIDAVETIKEYTIENHQMNHVLCLSHLLVNNPASQ